MGAAIVTSAFIAGTGTVGLSRRGLSATQVGIEYRAVHEYCRSWAGTRTRTSRGRVSRESPPGLVLVRAPVGGVV